MDKGLFYRLWILFFLCVSGLGEGRAQSDTEFWFVAPEVAASHGDLPIRLGLSTFDEAATVRISMPANPNFPTLTAEIPAFTLEERDLSIYQQLIENWPANTVNKKGLFIESTVPISAYYQVARRNNQDIYALKGNNALGTEFFIPSQNRFPNIHGQAAIDIVASQDGTTISIFPANNLFGVTGRDPIEIQLNRGESYGVWAAGMTAASHLQGTRIVSDKPIAVTNSDDSIINIETTGWDLAGDQLVPVDILGTEYIVVRGDAASEQVYIVATEDNTEINYFNPIQTTVSINQGGSTSLNLTGTSTFIQSNKPIYVWHLSGVNNEAGAALIPPITCTGNQRVNFMRPIDQSFQLIVLTRSEHVGDFILDGNATSSAFSVGAFSSVPGTNDSWQSARINVSSLDLGFHQLENTTGLFHLGTLAFPGQGGGSSYGYFSSYNSLNLGEERTFCEGEILELDAGPDALSYEWQDGSTERNFTVLGSGIYWVKTRLLGGCELVDTVAVEEIQLQLELGPDSTLCEGETLNLSANNPFAIYQWQDGSTANQFRVEEPGIYKVDISRDECSASDSVNIDYIFFPELELGVDTFICEGDNLLLDAGEDSIRWTFLWEDGSTEPERLIDTTGTYRVALQIERCIEEDEIFVEEIILGLELGRDSTLCEGESLLLDATNPGANYSWQDDSSSPQYLVENPGTYLVQVQREACSVFDTLEIDYIDVPELNLGPDTLLCENEDIELDVFFPEALYLWENGSTEPIREVNAAGWYVIQRDYLGCLRSDSLFVIPTIPQVSLRPDTLICLTDSVRLSTNPRKATLLWEDGSTATERYVKESGVYTVVATNRCASAEASMELIVEDCTCQLLLPNVFTPNQDGIHDSYIPEFDCNLANYSIEIFDRWGHILFTSEDPTRVWDGTDPNGNALQEGVYFFQLFYRGSDRWNQQDIRRKGNILLMR